MDDSALAQLSEEQLAALSDELKAVFCLLTASDQVFFATNFQAKVLPNTLARKAEILKRDRVYQENLDQLKASMRARGEAMAPAGEDKGADLLTTAAAVLGVGAAAVVVATDNTAFYRGVKPSDLVQPLATEFQAGKTAISATGSPDALIATVFLHSGAQRVPAMTINLTTLNDGTEVKVNDLSTKGIIESIKSGAGKLFDIAQDGLNLLRRTERGASANDVLSSAKDTLDGGTDLAQTLDDLKLKDRAWKVVKEAAESIEAAYRDRVEKERQVRLALEGAWDRHINCPTCGVPFAPEDTVCRVCTTARPEKPLKADPRRDEIVNGGQE